MAISTISVTANTSTISVDTTTNTVSVTSTPTTVSVGTATQVTTAEIRGALSNVSPILYNSTSGVFSFDGSSVFTGRTTDDLAEGSTNKYFTAARARSNISVTDGGGLGNLAYNSSTGVITYNGASDLELRSKISVTDSGGFGSLTYSNATGVINFTGTSTTDVRGSISGGTGVTYNSGTGVISALGLNSTSSSFATEGVMANTHAIYPTGRQYSEAYDVGISYDSSTGGFSVAYPQKSFHARFKNTAIDTTRGHVLAVTGYDASNDIPIVDYLDTTLAGNSIVAGVYMESIGTVSNSAVSYPKVAVATQGYITSGAYNGLSGLKTGDILYATKVGSRGGYTSTIPTNTYNGIVDPIGKIVEQDGTLYTLYIDVTQPAIDTSNISLTQGSATQTAGRPVIGVSGSEIEVGSGGSAGLTVVNRPTGHRINLSLTSITGVSDVAKTFEVSGHLGGNNKNIALQDINLANLDNATSGFVSNAQVLSHISSSPLTVGGNLNVSGNIIATGNIDYENVTDLFVTDQKITLNANAATNSNVQIIANRPQSTSVEVKWNEDTDKWTFTNNGSTYYNIPTSTSDLAEGTNLYYTDGRFDTRLATKSTSNLSEGTNLYYTVARANTAITDYDGALTPSSLTATGNIQGAYVKGNGSELSGLTTTQVSEGTNLYYTTARANSAIADYTGTISTGNTISGTTVTATSSAKTNKIEPNSGNDLDLYDVNKLKYNADKSNIHWNTGNVTQIGSVLRKTTGALVFYNSETVTTGSTNQGLIGSTDVGGVMATRSPAWNGGPTGGVLGIDGSAVMTAGSNVVQLTGLQKLTSSNVPAAGGELNYYYLGLYAASLGYNPRTTVDLATVFHSNMALKFSNTSLASFDGPFPKGTVVSSVANSSATGGIANVIMSNPAERTTTFTIGSALDAFGLYHTVRDTSTGDYRFLSGVSGDGLLHQTPNGLRSTGPNDFSIEGTAELGANYFQRFTSTSLSNVNGSITATDFTKANLSVANSPNVIEHENGFHRFKNTIVVGDKSDTSSRNLHTDPNPGFGLNIQWSGLGDTDVYGSTVQPAMTFSNFTDGSLQSSSGFEDKAGPRVMLGSFNGNKENNWTNWYPRQGQELGKFSWYSTSGESSSLSTTIPPAAITAIASHDWDTTANVSLDIIHYAQNKTAADQIAFLKHSEDTSIGASSGKQVKIGQGGAVGSDVRTSSNLAATHLTVDATETELFNRLQLYSLTTTEINALSSPQAGQVVYNSTLNQMCIYNGSAWQKITQATM